MSKSKSKKPASPWPTFTGKTRAELCEQMGKLKIAQGFFVPTEMLTAVPQGTISSSVSSFKPMGRVIRAVTIAKGIVIVRVD